MTEHVPKPTRTIFLAMLRRLPASQYIPVVFLAVFALWLGSFLRSCNGERADEPATGVTAEVVRSDLLTEVSAGGELESVNAIEIRCEVEGFQPKIIELLPEGTLVTKGQSVARLDPGEIKNAIAQQEIKTMQAEAAAKAAHEEFEIQKNLNASNIAQAELAVRLAELDKNKYVKGEYKVELDDLNGSIALAQAELQNAKDAAEYYQRLVKKGFRTPEQLRAKEQAVKRYEFYLTRDKEKLRVLENFTRERTLVELTAKAEESVRELDRVKRSAAALLAKAKTDLDAAEVTARLETSQLNKLQEQLENCTIRAPKDGVLTYANDKRQRIELGAVAHFQQKLFNLPDLTRLRVVAFVHESVIKKIKPGMKAEIRVEALPNVVVPGRVEKVATFYDPTRHWMLGGVKEYATTVGTEQLVAEGLKPGMTAEVRIRVGESRNVLIVPIGSVAEHHGRYYCFVETPGGVERREVHVGASNESFVEVVEGLEEGENVFLNARQRLASEASSEDPDSQRQDLGMGVHDAE